MTKGDKYNFLKNVGNLFSGAWLAQIINFIALVILQRYFYSPEQYAPFRLFFEFSLVFSSVSSLRLESGLILEREDKPALTLLRICIKYCIYTSIIGGLLFTIYYYNEIEVFKHEWILLLLMPLGILANGMIQISQSFFTRSKQFSTISLSKITHSLTGGLTQVLNGIIGFNFTGLITGRMIGLFSSNLIYFKQFFKSFKWLKKHDLEEKRLLKKHKKFISFTSPGFFIGSSINLVILVVLTRFYGEEFSGLTAAGIQYLGLICMIFSTSFAQVYYNEIAQIDNPEKLISSYNYWVKRLTLVAILGWTILYFIPPSLVEYILGEKWSGLLYIIKIISPWMGIMFVTSSLSYIFIRLGRQKEIFFFDLFHLLIILIALYLGHNLFGNNIKILYVISFTQCVFYILSLTLAYVFLKNNIRKSLKKDYINKNE